jgi:hypothetical protein
LLLRRRARPSIELRCDALDRGPAVHVSDERHRQGRGPEPRVMEVHQVLTSDPLDALERAFRAPAVRVRRAVQHLEEGLDRANCRVVFVPPDDADELRPALDDFCLWKERTRHRVQHNREHLVEVFGEAGAGRGRRVARRGDPQRDSAIIELLRDNLARSSFAAAIEQPTHKIGHTRQGR